MNNKPFTLFYDTATATGTTTTATSNGKFSNNNTNNNSGTASFRYYNSTSTIKNSNKSIKSQQKQQSIISKLSKCNKNNVRLPTTTLSSNSSPNNKSQKTVWIITITLLLSMALILICTLTFIYLAVNPSSSMGSAFAIPTSIQKAAKSSSSKLSAITTTNNKGTMSSSSSSSMYDKGTIEKKMNYALWSYFAGDALASPTHWFYGGFPQIQKYYGPNGITTYTKPAFHMAGSILNKSNLSGGGRSTPTSAATLSRRRAASLNRDGEAIEMPPTIIGYVINHGKQELWDPNKEIHYHATLQAGENTLEVQIGRILMKSIIATNGKFDMNHFRKAYIQFMTTPNSHNDTYASTCHRMFFANYIYKQLPAEQCPDNDSHNVDTIDGLVLPTISALAVAARKDGTEIEAGRAAAQTAAVTRRSNVLEQYANEWGKFIYAIIRNNNNGSNTEKENVQVAAERMAQMLQLRKPQIRTNDEMTACYINSAMPALLDSIVKYYGTTSVWDALLHNANTGGENVHRGSCLGAVLGVAAATKATSATSPSSSSSKDDQNMIEPDLINGLYHQKELQHEIHSFVQSVMNLQES